MWDQMIELPSIITDNIFIYVAFIVKCIIGQILPN